MDGRYRNGGSAWSPDDLGQARMASLGWLISLATKAGSHPDVHHRRVHEAAEKSPDRSPAALEPLLPPGPPPRIRRDLFDAARGLARRPRRPIPPAQFAFLNILPIRDTTSSSQSVGCINSHVRHPTIPRRRCPGQIIDLVLISSYQSLTARKPDWAHAAILTAVAEELKRAGKLDEALEQFYKAAVESPDRRRVRRQRPPARRRSWRRRPMFSSSTNDTSRLVGSTSRPGVGEPLRLLRRLLQRMSSTPADSIGRRRCSSGFDAKAFGRCPSACSTIT